MTLSFPLDDVVSSNMTAEYVLAKWQSVLLLLSVCRLTGCGAGVLPENIKVSGEGISCPYLNILWEVSCMSIFYFHYY